MHGFARAAYPAAHSLCRVALLSHVPITFLLDVGDEDIASWRALCPDREPQRLVLGEHYWIAMTYARLRDAGADVRVDNRVPREGIVVFYAGDKHKVWAAVRRGSHALLVAVRSDRHRVGFADVEVVQNASSACGRRSFHIPHWPQPGLVPRDPSRGTALRTVLFPGTPQNLHPGFSSREWLDAMAERSVGFRCSSTESGGARAWHDCSDVDLVLAIRPGSGEVANKPAWKLVNAWLAGTPAILGPECAYRELRRDALDYIEATDPATALAGIDRLRASPALYAGMVAHGRERGRAHADQAVTAAWLALADDVLEPGWHCQRQHPVPIALRRMRDAAAHVRRLGGVR